MSNNHLEVSKNEREMLRISLHSTNNCSVQGNRYCNIASVIIFSLFLVLSLSKINSDFLSRASVYVYIVSVGAWLNLIALQWVLCGYVNVYLEQCKSAKCVYAIKCMYTYVKDCVCMCVRFSLLVDVCCTQTTHLTFPGANYRQS